MGKLEVWKLLGADYNILIGLLYGRDLGDA